jgi:hypothetical protein
LHRDALSAEEIGTMEGIRLTRPLRTIVDLISERILSPDLIEQAITQAVDRGFFTLDQLRSTQLTRRVSRLVRQFAPMVEA